MRKLLWVLAVSAGLESAALACSCVPPPPAAEARTAAREAVEGAVAIVEVETLSEYRPGGRGERVRVLRTLFGKAPATFAIERGPFASSASCDLLLSKGAGAVLIVRAGEGGAYRIQSLCSNFLTSEDYLPVTIEEARRASDTPAKAGERASNCPAPGPVSAPATV